VRLSLGDPERVEEHFLHQAELSAKAVDLSAVATALSDLGEYLLTVDRLEEAVDYHQQSLTTWQRLGDPKGITEQLRRRELAQARVAQHNPGQ
jgi:Tetratricopeptide repeat